MKRTLRTTLKQFIPLLYPVVGLFFSANCNAESFTASVTFRLIDPNTLTKDQLLKFGSVKNIPNGQCTMNPANGQLFGDTCLAKEADISKIIINGIKDLDISVNLSQIQTESIHFDPSLFNGTNQLTNFVLSNNVHTITLGGTITQGSALALETPELSYDVEIVYP